MALWQRTSAGTVAVMLAILPLCLEQCRAACLLQDGPATQVTSAESCHHAAANDPSESTVNTGADGCGHRNGTEVVEPARITGVKSVRASQQSMVTVALQLSSVVPVRHDLAFRRALIPAPPPAPLILPLRV